MHRDRDRLSSSQSLKAEKSGSNALETDNAERLAKGLQRKRQRRKGSEGAAEYGTEKLGKNEK